MVVLITGGLGFIGSHTAAELLGRGRDVVIVDNLANSKAYVLNRIAMITGRIPHFFKGDILDTALLDAIFDKFHIDAVIHFAGLKAVSESLRLPLAYYKNNVAGTISLLNVMKKHSCCRLVFSSSASVYGEANLPPFTEDMPTCAVNPYSRTKKIIEDILFDFAAADSDMSFALLRYFNPIGAHKSGLIGEDPNGIPNNLFPYIGLVAAGALPFLKIFGNDYDTPDGTCIRDYIHVSDLAEGHTAILDYIASVKGCAAINLGSGRGSSVLDMIKAFERATRIKIPYQFAPRREGDVPVSFACVKKAKELLGWECRRSLETSCKDGWRYYSAMKK